jgi:murein L,D-transpeptidase YcbB/YkuD
MRKTGAISISVAVGLVILTLTGHVGCRRGSGPLPELQALLEADTLDRQVGDARVRAAVRAFYLRTDATLAWSTSKPSKAADAALAVLASARDHGLDPDDYQWAALVSERDAVARAPRGERSRHLAVFDVRLTSALLRLGHDVALGRVRPDAVVPRWKSQRAAPDLAATLADARTRVGEWLPAIQPRHPEYAALQRGLAALHGARAKGGWPQVPPAALKPGDAHPAVVALRRRLAASGDLAAANAEGTRFDGALEAALRVFQEHHGLPATGRLDQKTRAALDVPLDARIGQVSMNLERWRWMPDDFGDRHFRVNVPYFHLEAFEQGRLALDIRAVVGKRGNETPIFSERMTHVVLSPYWNIPPSIAAGETLPAASSDPAYLERQNIEVVRVSGSAADVVDPATLDWNDEALLQDLRFRQRPGAGNALGLVKFMFPNEYDVYVHDTPADALFSRLGRAFSHGCVRVEEPMALARYVLRDQPKWTPDAIEAAMHAGAETHVKLRTPIPIHILYFTAWADANGGLQFREDVYGYDAKQDKTVTKPGWHEGTKAGTKARPSGDGAKVAGVQKVVATGASAAGGR